MRRLFFTALLAAVSVALSRGVSAQSAENVAVVINDDSLDSRRIGDYYASARALPESNVVHIKTSVDETIERDVYLRTIELPVSLAIRKAGLQDRLLYLVLTKGIPLRVAGTTGPSGTLSSVDSELTLLYRRMTGRPVPVPGNIENPYYLGVREVSEARPFSHRDHDIYLVTRLDAFTADQAIALIDRAKAPSTEGRIVLDQRGGTPAPGDDWLSRAAQRLTTQNQQSRVVLESTGEPARNEKSVLGYYSWGASDPANRARNVAMGFTAGSIAANLTSFDARTFHQPPDTWQPTASTDKATWFEGSGDTLIGDLINAGATGVSGQVGEAYMFGAVRPQVLFPAYLAGFNLAEAYYLSIPVLGWQTIVIGDPLCAPFSRQPLARAGLEEETDAATQLPGSFARRRLSVYVAANSDLPRTAVAAALRADTQLERGDPAGARKSLEEAVDAAPKASGLMVRLAQLEEQAGAYDAAIARYQRVLESQPTNVIVLNNLAFALAVRRNVPAEALPLARRAFALAPRSGTVVDTLGWIEHLSGNHETAAKLFEQAVRLEPGHPEIRLHTAIAFAAAGSADRAETELKEALRLDPGLEQREEVHSLRQKIASPK